LTQDLAFCAATLFGDPFAVDHAQLDTALRAVAATDAGSLSLWTLHAAAHQRGPRGLRADVNAMGLSVAMVEACTAWPSGDRAAVDAEADEAMAWAEPLGADRVLAVTLEPSLPDRAAALDGLGRLCDRLATAGLRVVVEFLPWSGVPDILAADELVAGVGRPNLGVLLDCWHWCRQAPGPDLSLLDRVDVHRIEVVQLCDAAPAGDPAGDLMTEALTARLLPGQGEAGVTALVAALAERGLDPVWSPEVFSADLVARGPQQAAAEIVAASRKVLSAA